MVAWLVITALAAGIITADLLTRLFIRRWVSVGLLFLFSNIVLLCRWTLSLEDPWPAPLTALSIALGSYFLVRLLFYMPRYDIGMAVRLRIMMGGRRIFLVSLLALVGLVPASMVIWLFRGFLGLSDGAAVATIAAALGIDGFVVFVGGIRMLSTSRRLGFGKRVLFLMVTWIPLANIGMLIWFSKIVKREFWHDYAQVELQNARAESEVCKTRYPLLLLHGAGFRDYRFLNYWGRIPSLLIKNGARVFYGRQQAWGTVEQNAEEVGVSLVEALAESGAEKVNIIAHSKGGLDARYLISSLGMGEHVASLTTISTPHHGSEMVHVLRRMSKQRYDKLCRLIDRFYSKIGDRAPDVRQVAEQLSPEGLARFNTENPDVEGVYYQSYAAQMEGPASSGLLLAPNFLMNRVTGSNDGLVTVESAKWGNFRGTFKSKTRRGVSHADLVDLMHQDYEGFNMAEEYVAIVAELKEMGF